MLQISVAPSGTTAVIRLSGNVEAGDSASVFSLLNEMIVGEYDDALVDLSRCRDLDSTFIGMLVVLCETYAKKEGGFCLVNVSEQNRRALKLLGVSTMIPMRHLAFDEAPEFVPLDLETFRKSATERIEIMALTHRALIEADKENEERFGSFLRLLEAERSG